MTDITSTEIVLLLKAGFPNSRIVEMCQAVHFNDELWAKLKGEPNVKPT